MNVDENQTERCDLCVVGAGIAGVNALAVASGYLTPRHRVILVDQRPSLGGMWTETYDYVRLHQPYERFTAGDIPWTIRREPSYLASKDEVLAHFDHCMASLREKVDLVELYDTTYQEHRVVSNGDGYEAHILCTTKAREKPRVIVAKRCVKAFGFRIPKNDPLPFSSRGVHSVSPQQAALFGGEMDESEAPVYVIGGGKTGMDTAHALIKRYPKKAIYLVAGSGTVFFNRNAAFPRGLRRWWRGETGLARSLDLALRYNGDNDDEVCDYLRERYGLSLGRDARQFVFGLLSEEELAAISAGLRGVFEEYVDDIVDTSGQPEMVFRSGKRKAIEPGSWIVNCTGYVLRESHPYEPYVSDHGTVVSIQPTSAIHFLSTFASYFLAHLLYLDKLEELPLYEVDYQTLSQKNKSALSLVGLTHTLYNQMIILGATPGHVFRDCGLDFDRWFPFPRRFVGGMALKRNSARYLGHFRRTLDRVQEKYGVRCGVLRTGL